MYNKAVALLLIGVTSFSIATLTSVNLSQDGNLSFSTSELKAEARRVPIRKPVNVPKKSGSKPTIRKPLPSGSGKAVGYVLKGLEGASNLIDGYEFFKSFNGGDIFIVPNEFANEWNDVAQMCDLRNGNLIWRNDLKTCIPR